MIGSSHFRVLGSRFVFWVGSEVRGSVFVVHTGDAGNGSSNYHDSNLNTN